MILDVQTNWNGNKENITICSKNVRATALATLSEADKGWEKKFPQKWKIFCNYSKFKLKTTMSYTCNLLHRLTCTSTGNRIFAWQIVLVDIHELHTELFSRVGYPFFFCAEDGLEKHRIRRRLQSQWWIIKQTFKVFRIYEARY